MSIFSKNDKAIILTVAYTPPANQIHAWAYKEMYVSWISWFNFYSWDTGRYIDINHFRSIKFDTWT